MNKKSINVIVKSAIIGALYAALTYLFMPVSYGGLQFRISEILIILVVFNPKYIVGLTIGCFIANIASPMAWDILFGTLATLISLLCMSRCKNLYIASLYPVVFNGLIVGFELWWLMDLQFGLSMIQVMLGEAAVLYLIGIPIMSNIANKADICEVLDLKPAKAYLKSNLYPYIGLTIMMGILFYVMPYSSAEQQIFIYDLALSHKELFIVCALFILIVLNYFTPNKIARLVILILFNIMVLGFFLYAGIINTAMFSSAYYYLMIFIMILYTYILAKLR